MLFHEMTQQRDGQFRHNTRQVCLPCISMFFLYIFNNYFNKYFHFHKDTNAVVQMLQAFQVSELQYPAYTSDYKHGCHGSTYKTVYTRQISKSSDFWLYVRSDTLYRKTRITIAFYEVYASFALQCYKPHFCEIYTSVERINRSYKIIDLT